ncbi:MAG TPA: hypothetical protein V6C65_38175 [Allocoleopsis sp.]
MDKFKFETEEGSQGGLVTWGVLIVIFALLGVPALLSILLGGIGGIAVGTLIAYWRAEKLPPDPTQPKQDEDAIKPVKRLIERLPVPAWRVRPPSPFRPKPPRRIGGKRE